MDDAAGKLQALAAQGKGESAATRYPAERAPLRADVRRWLWLPLILAVGNGIFLYFLPWLAETLYAWSITPPVNAAFMGAGYLTGVVASALALFVARYWRSVRPLMWPFFTLGLGLLGATLLHADRFFWGYALTWAWTFIYFILPPGVVIIWRAQERMVGSLPASDARLQPLKWLCWPLGVITCAVGLLLYLLPELIIPNWPWQITPLLARCFGSWYLLLGLTLAFLAATTRRPSEILIPAVSLSAFNFFLLLLPILYAGSMRFDRPSFWLWLVLHTVLLLSCLYAAWRSWALARDEAGKVAV